MGEPGGEEHENVVPFSKKGDSLFDPDLPIEVRIRAFIDAIRNPDYDGSEDDYTDEDFYGDMYGLSGGILDDDDPSSGSNIVEFPMDDTDDKKSPK